MRSSRLTRPWTVDGRPVDVPGCWEDAGIAKDDPGPYDYRTTFVPPGIGSGERVWLRFGAVSYACTVFVDETEVGRHVGMWDAFEVEITSAVRPGHSSELRVRVEKPASLTAGPDSPAVPGSFPTRETLAGFLPYVWGHVHGGIWQDVECVVTGGAVFGDVTAWGTPAGVLTVDAPVSAPGTVTMSVTDPHGVLLAKEECRADGRATFTVSVPSPRGWSPYDPSLYTVRLSLTSGESGVGAHADVGAAAARGVGETDERVLRVGLRALSVDGSALVLNGSPIYPRMVLSWGWYPDTLHAAPDRDRVRADLVLLREMGFNGVKLCLWFPPQYYFDLADELGMLVWVELPMWLPHPTDHFRDQLTAEADRLVRAARDHPSVILYTLGCELSAVIGDDVLGPLYSHVKELGRDALVRDNSGSGEAYGGLLTEYADFYDHHLYCELHHFRETLEHFAPGWRDEKPWLFGEFCDLDTFRDLRRLESPTGERPWWTSGDSTDNPQGARWQYDVHEHETRLRANGFWDRGAELEAISHRQALLHRKVTLEAVRLRRDSSGYVVTGERDTPISTAGLWDDLGALKVDVEEFRAFNADLVLCLGFDRRRTWLAGGDRPAFGDPWCHEAGAIVRPHLILAHHGRDAASAWLEWTIALDGAKPFTSGSSGPSTPLSPGSVQEVGLAEFEVPAVDHPRQAVLQVRAWVGGDLTTNTWRFWFFPRTAWSDVDPFVLADPGGRLEGLSEVAAVTVEAEATAGAAGDQVGSRTPGGVGSAGSDDVAATDAPPVDGSVVVATRWTRELAAHVAAGGRAVLLADEASGSPLPLVPMPFWREAVKVLESHEAWGDFPHNEWVDLQFAGCATDLALDVSGMREQVRPILRRVDARTAHVHDYASELAWGAGRLIVSTLRFEGSRGDQPRGLRRNTGAAYLLSRWVHALQSQTAG